MRLRNLLLALLITALVPLAASAAPTASTLGPDGAVYTLLAGSYGELFPGGRELDRDTSVLSLVRDLSDGTREHLLVPGTEGPEIDAAGSLFVEDRAATVYVLWQSWHGVLTSSLHLRGLSPDGWGEPIQVRSHPFAMLTSPRLAISRDTYRVAGENGEPVPHERTFLHLAWVEETAGGSEHIFYVPMLLLDGRQVESTAVVDLSSLVPEPGADSPLGAEVEVTSLVLRSGVEANSVTLGFTDLATRQVVGMEIRLVPGELSELADDLAEFLDEEIPAHANAGNGLQSVADRSRAHLIDVGYRIQPAALNHLADETRTYLRALPANTGREAAIGGSRAHLIDVGARIDRSGLTRVTGGGRAHLIDVGVQADSPRGGLSDHQVSVHVTASWPAPEIGPSPEVHVSADGQRSVLGWRSSDGARLLYRESQEDGWNEVNTLHLGPELTLGEAQEMLARRVEN